MKFIFDFDDVLVRTTKGFREHIYSTLEKVGVPRELGKKYLEKERSLKYLALGQQHCFALKVQTQPILKVRQEGNFHY